MNRLKPQYSKRILFLFLLFCSLSFIIFPRHVMAGSTTIYGIDIDVRLNNDGSADITETWDISSFGITEWYLVQGSLGHIEIEDFSVKDETGRIFKNEGAWNIDRSIDEKAGKCGIVDKHDGSYELCWGVGSEGQHCFTASYHMTNFVKGFDDYCGFNQRFINDSLSSNPQRISVTVSNPGTVFTPDEVTAWAFGFEGTVTVENSHVSVVSKKPLSSSDYVTVMCRFPRSMFDPENIVDGSFTDMKSRALENSDYRHKPDIIVILFIIGFVVCSIMLVIYINVVSKKNNRVRTFEEAFREDQEQSYVRFYLKPIFWAITLLLLILSPIFMIFFVAYVFFRSRKDGDEVSKDLSGNAYPLPVLKQQAAAHTNYYRDIPLNGNIAATYVVSTMTSLGSMENNVIGAYLLKWLQHGCITIRNERKTGLSGKLGMEAPSVILLHAPENVSQIETHLYSILKSASGGDDILQEQEMYRWSQKNSSQIKKFMDDLKKYGKACLKKSYYLGVLPSYGPLGLAYIPQDAFTEAGREQVLALKGLKNFLRDFTLINERQPDDVVLWDEYLIDAQIFGIADKVAAQFKKIYPDYFIEHATYYSNYAASYAVIHSISKASTSGASSSSSSHSSSSGGGGSSGGGSGGGGR